MGMRSFDCSNNCKYVVNTKSYISTSYISSSRGSTKVVRASSRFASNWLNADPLIFVLGFLGWTIPSAIPVSGFGGSSLFSKFISSIGEELAHFPKGPALNSDFWLYLVLYHVGLFLCLLLGQIGVQGRKQGYFSR